MSIAPPVTVSVASAWKASSPVAMANVPPETVMSALECTASSAASMVNAPPEITRLLTALRPFMLVLLSEVSPALDAVSMRPPRKPPQDSEDWLSPLTLPPPARMS